MINWPAVGLVTSVSLVANLPLGYWRAGLRKFSPAWFVAVHLSIPLIVYLRYRLGVSYLFIPFTLGMAVAGQLLGGIPGRRNEGKPGKPGEVVDRTRHYG
ncbi:MAG: hypothetical protein M0Z41_00660 [Peptococcaceae bacterium]|jgi:hypothetical protein|nr:hypothetical protein [Peptococcaceae bacterium]